MKKCLLVVLSLLLVLMPIKVKAAENKEVTIYLFRGATCAHCEEALKYMSGHRDKILDNVKIVTYEVWEHSVNAEFQKRVEAAIDTPEDKRGTVPFFVIGEHYVYGYGTTTFNTLMNYAKDYQEGKEEYNDVVASTLSTSNLSVTAMTLDDLYPEANPIVSGIIFGIFGVIIIGFIGMILFSRKK